MTFPEGDADDHLAVWGFGDMNEAFTVHEWETVPLFVAVQDENGLPLQHVHGFAMKLRGFRGMDFSRQCEDSFFIPRDALEEIVGYMTDALEVKDPRLVSHDPLIAKKPK